jgi:hypothetical protein
VERDQPRAWRCSNCGDTEPGADMPMRDCTGTPDENGDCGLWEPVYGGVERDQLIEQVSRARYAAGNPVLDPDDKPILYDDLGPLLRRVMVADAGLYWDIIEPLIRGAITTRIEGLPHGWNAVYDAALRDVLACVRGDTEGETQDEVN